MGQIDLALAVVRQVEEMRKDGGYPADGALDELGGKIAQGFKVRKQEVAILRVSSDGTALSFVYPLKLVQIGAIPLTTTNSLATKTIRDKKAEIVNNFSLYKHPTVFESVKLSEKDRAVPIQKIISSPMMVGGKVVGLLQLSPKPRSDESPSPHFTSRL